MTPAPPAESFSWHQEIDSLFKHVPPAELATRKIRRNVMANSFSDIRFSAELSPQIHKIDSLFR